LRLTNFLIEVGGYAVTGSAGSRANARSTMLAHSSASYSDGIKGPNDTHTFAFGSFLEEGANTQTHLYLSGDQNILRNNGSMGFTGSLSAICHNPPASEGPTVKIRSNLLFFAEVRSKTQWLYTGSLVGRN